ncbi:MAG: FtsX-like permease family protein [Actinomycetota bacterium]
MFTLTVRSLLSHKIRFALTAFAVVLGVGFVVGAFVIRDGLKDTFDGIVEDINADLDAEVRGATEFDDGTGLTPPIPEELVDVVAGIDGVEAATPVLTSFSLVPIDAEGENIFDPNTGPTISTNSDSSGATDVQVQEGAEPEAGEFMVDIGTLDDNDLVIGDAYEVITSSGRETFTLVGSFRFGDDNELGGAKVFVFELDDLQRMMGVGDTIQEIQVIADDTVDSETLLSSIAAALPDGVEVVSSDVAISEDQEDFAEIVDILGNVLLGFAGISLFVAAFLINNTFNIVLGQRVRELALLRAVGASARQVRGSVLGESLLVGVVASILGILFGMVLAVMLRGLFGALGADLPSFGLTPSTSTILAGLVVGIGVTMLSSITPSRRASTIPPVAAMQDGFRFGEGEGRRRTIIGASLLAIGLLGMALGLFGEYDSAVPQLTLLVLGALSVFIGTTLLSPLFSSPATKALGAPLRYLPWLGMSGRLAQENSSRNNQRTAATAGALMVGLALVGMAAVTGESLKETFRNTLDSAIEADWYISSESFEVGFGTGLAEEIDAAPEFDRSTPFRVGVAQVDGESKDVFAADLAQIDGLIDPDVVEGSLDAGPGDLLLHEDSAEDQGVSVGDSLTLTYANGDTEDVMVAAIYGDASILGNWVIDLSSWQAGRFGTTDDLFVAAKNADGVSMEEAQAVLDEIATDYPQVNVESSEEFADSQEAQLDTFLAIIQGMVGFSVLIALLGIANTLALSVFERTREIGLLRAVGMSRRQARSMIRWEAAIVATFGAALGVVLGIVFGYGVTTALPDSFVSDFAVPWGTLIVYVIVAGIAGLVAASLPARRAGRLNVLEAIRSL